MFGASSELASVMEFGFKGQLPLRYPLRRAGFRQVRAGLRPARARDVLGRLLPCSCSPVVKPLGRHVQ